MKHKLGNSTHCVNCFHYRPKDESHQTFKDGFCTIGHLINGRKISFEPQPVYWNNGTGCQDWEEVQTRLTHFEVMTLKPDPKRTEAERRYIEELLRKEDKDANDSTL